MVRAGRASEMLEIDIPGIFNAMNDSELLHSFGGMVRSRSTPLWLSKSYGLARATASTRVRALEVCEREKRVRRFSPGLARLPLNLGSRQDGPRWDAQVKARRALLLCNLA